MLQSFPKSHYPIKFFCSYSGRILPRYPDGRLRYHGGVTRVLSLNYSVSFSELLLKMEELCGSPVSLIRCKLPTEDLDALVSITSDEDLANLIEEYGHATADPPKIRAFLSVPKLVKKPSPPSSSASSCSSDGSPPKSPPFHYSAAVGLPPRYPSRQCIRRAASIPAAAYLYPIAAGKTAAGETPKRYLYQYRHDSNGGGIFLVHNGYHPWQ